jgi:hypothetical protein
MTRILQISDPHIMPEDALFQGRVDTAKPCVRCYPAWLGCCLP